MPRPFASRIGALLYLVEVFIGIGFVYHFIVALVRWDLSPWWFWPAGIIALAGLHWAAGLLMEVGE